MSAAGASTGELPVGLPVVLDADVRRLEGGAVLLGGEPGRLMRLTPAGVRWLDRLADGRPVPQHVRALARTLVDGGLAHPRPAPVPATDVEVVVPVRDRADELGRCLSALGRGGAVLVVDDGSDDPGAVAAVARRHGARVLRLPRNGGPAAARNAGIAATRSEVVALLDSDCLAPPGWLEALLGHFADPSVAAVAPRVQAAAEGPRAGGGLLAVYARERGPLDLADREARVRPGSRVPYVPTAALLVRRTALPSPAFDPSLRFGEDVDLVWRLHDRGWTVRYDPRTVVRHTEPERWRSWLTRRHAYGTSAAPLADRHGDRLTPLVLPPLPTLAVVGLLARRPGIACAAAVLAALRLHRQLRAAGLERTASRRTAVRVTAQAVLGVAWGAGGAGAVVTAPLLVALLVPRRTRAAAALALVVPPLAEHRSRRPAVDPVRWTAVRLLDDLAYASGVWRSCWSSRTVAPLVPRRSRPR